MADMAGIERSKTANSVKAEVDDVEGEAAACWADSENLLTGCIALTAAPFLAALRTRRGGVPQAQAGDIVPSMKV
ncbi:hypothetical protein DM813_13500 [Pseudomonas alkylphenolica]|uniref:Uncharacterized protein n=1 Tax=Pseudomonas alkylphenolica TaxID=237609 RepID=A0A443ZS56_9PSED|nr:hypothetical protein DM813_13500 [Pseudomonas alkylphenolica]